MSRFSTLYTGAMWTAAQGARAVLPLLSRGAIRISERYGDWKLPPGRYVWFHGASFGEIAGIAPLVKQWRGASRVLVTATSPTGLDAAASLGAELRILPFDVPAYLERALAGVTVERLVITETEIWPNLLDVVSRRGAFVDLINARISDRTFGRYRGLRAFFRPSLAKFERILTSDQTSVARFVELGADPAKVRFAGHTKFDVEPEIVSSDERERLRAELFSRAADPIVVCGSVRPGEERALLDGFRRALGSGHRCSLLLVPRHAEKFEYFADALRASQLGWSKMSEGPLPTEAPILLVDRMGILRRLYGAADVSFVGASLVPVGGHNPMEAACCGVPVAMGPHHHVYKDVVADLRAEGAFFEIRGAEDFAMLLGRVAAEDPALGRAREGARAVWTRHHGATRNVLEALGVTA